VFNIFVFVGLWVQPSVVAIAEMAYLASPYQGLFWVVIVNWLVVIIRGLLDQILSGLRYAPENKRGAIPRMLRRFVNFEAGTILINTLTLLTIVTCVFIRGFFSPNL
jgi:hypothetical protein